MGFPLKFENHASCYRPCFGPTFGLPNPKIGEPEIHKKPPQEPPQRVPKSGSIFIMFYVVFNRFWAPKMATKINIKRVQKWTLFWNPFFPVKTPNINPPTLRPPENPDRLPPDPPGAQGRPGPDPGKALQWERFARRLTSASLPVIRQGPRATRPRALPSPDLSPFK